MKAVLFLACVPIAIFIGLCIAVLDLSDSKLQAYEATIRTPMSTKVMQGGVVVVVGVALVGGVFMYEERQRVERTRTQNRVRRLRRKVGKSHDAVFAAPSATFAPLTRRARENRENLVITPAPPAPANPFVTPPAPPAPPAPVAGMSRPAPVPPKVVVPTPAPVPLAVVLPAPSPVMPAPVVVPPPPVPEVPAPVAKPVTVPPVVSAPVVPLAPIVDTPIASAPVEKPRVSTPIAPGPMMAAPVEGEPRVEPSPASRVDGGTRGTGDPLSHWGLREPAFDNAPNTRFLYLSPAHAEALFRLRYAIRQRKGCAALTGTPGCGKTTLTRALVRELDPARFDVALITSPMATPVAFLQELLYQLGIRTKADDKPTLLRALEVRLGENLRNNRDTVVIIDEAQLIEAEEVFTELRLLLNFQTDDRFLITLVLAGTEELVHTLRRHPHLAQRCAVRARLEPLDREQTGHYVRHRLVTAGRESETLTEDAVDELYAATGGTPRMINAVCDLALFVGASAGVPRVDGDLVRRVAVDMAGETAAVLV